MSAWVSLKHAVLWLADYVFLAPVDSLYCIVDSLSENTVWTNDVPR